ncbi:hypothetical protein [Bacillus marinisedimentorum]|uniref:hypothetical protein n=1 Tax=Bacillus marinisedimentorum TaxID=1821260 RepID=UPI00147100EC|nr:hypothetical protein [Bacillus marinisedimentorum]
MKILSDDFSRKFDGEGEFQGKDVSLKAVMNMFVVSLTKMIAGAGNAPHLQPLFKKPEMMMFFFSEEEAAAVELSDKGLRLLYALPDTCPDIIIRGCDGALVNLITGMKPLRTLERDKELSVKCTFRNKLWLESLFLMSKHHGQNII